MTFQVIFLTLLSFFFIEGFVKPLVAAWGLRWCRKYVPLLLNSLDPVMPEKISSLTKEELHDLIFYKAMNLAEENNDYLTKKDLEKIVKQLEITYSPLENAKKLNGSVRSTAL